jgi:hypothetical protein
VLATSLQQARVNGYAKDKVSRPSVCTFLPWPIGSITIEQCVHHFISLFRSQLALPNHSDDESVAEQRGYQRPNLFAFGNRAERFWCCHYGPFTKPIATLFSNLTTRIHN